MATAKQRIISLLLIVAFEGATVTAHAGLNDALNGMFSNVTAPQAFQNQMRSGLVGGGIGLRMPVRNINLFAFDPPRLSAGCGGLDFFGGSFSFINADQLVALFRQIAANAVGVAFKAAIDAINPKLGQLMEDFQNKIQSLNQMMKNTCAIANQVVKSITDPDARKEEADEEASKEETSKGAFDDLFAGVTSFFSEPNKATKNASAGGTCQTCGNPVWKAINDSDIAGRLGAPGTTESDPNGARETIMSLIGAVIMTPPPSSPDQTNPDGSPKPEVGATYAPSLSLMDLKNGSKVTGVPLKILRCTDGHDRDQCSQISETNMEFDGTLGYTNRMLFGDPAGGSVADDSIIGKLTLCTSSCDLTTAQKNFVQATTVPVLGLLRRVQKSPGAAANFGVIMAPIIADELAVNYGEVAMKAAKSVFSGTKVPKPDFVPKAETDLLAEMGQLRASASLNIQRILTLKQVADAIAASNPAIFAGSGK